MNRVATSSSLILFILGAAIGGGAVARDFAGHGPLTPASIHGGVGFHASGEFHSGGLRRGGGFRSGGGFHGGGGHGHFGVYLGAPLFWGPDYYSYPYSYPPDVTVLSSPPVYVDEGDQVAVPPPQSNYWYYCANPQGYYPYVTQCPAGWQRVAPQPPPPSGG